jgi:hypothetical protein
MDIPRRGSKDLPDGLVKHALQVALCQSRTFKVLMCANLLGHGQSLFVGDSFHLACAEGFCGRAVISQIELGTDEDNGDIGGVVFDFGEPLSRVSRRKDWDDLASFYLRFDVIE